MQTLRGDYAPGALGEPPPSEEERFAALVSLLTVCIIIFLVAATCIFMWSRTRPHPAGSPAVSPAAVSTQTTSAALSAVASLSATSTQAALSLPIVQAEAAVTLSSTDIVKQAMPSIAFIKAGDVEGTGFLVLQRGSKALFVTNDHVVVGKDHVSVVTADSQQHSGTVLAGDEDVDVALVSIDDASSSGTALPLGDSDALKVGEQLYVVGYALGSNLRGDPSVTRGILSGRRTVNNGTYLQTDAAINHGNSGGPVLNAQGQAVGMATWGFDAEEAQGINFALPSRVIQETVNRLLASAASPDVKVWAALPAAPAKVLGNGSTVWTGKELIVWGGEDDSGYSNAGARLDPASGKWSPLPLAGAPSPRLGNAAVWTGSDLLVWGGYQEDKSVHYFNDGGRFNPSTNTWAPIPPAPIAGRYLQSAVWTGKELLVWGGRGMVSGKLGDFADGARYNPTTNTWTPMAAGTLAPRDGQSAVWTGQELLVWGGEARATGSAKAQPLGDGAGYNPTTDLWSALPAAGAPTPRALPVAVWTGQELLIWGGLVGEGGLNDGARFNPATNRWTAIAASPLLAPRLAPSAVWVGGANGQPGKLVVWGGIGGSGNSALSLNDGAVYQPATGTWTALPATSLPSRAGADAYWTGSDVLFWGGMHVNRGSDIGSVSYRADGARLHLP